MEIRDLIQTLIKKGIGDYLVLHVTRDQVILGNFTFEKGNFVVKDQGLLTDMKPVQFLPCWENGLMGCIYYSDEYEWKSLSFNGLEECSLPVDLGATRGNVLRMTINGHGDRLCDFVGSAYRGFQLMLNNNFLPVILLKHVSTKTGENALAVSDLRTVPMSLDVISNITAVVKKSVAKRMSYTVEDLQKDVDRFNELFGDYKEKNNPD